MINSNYLDQFPLFFSNSNIRELAKAGKSKFISYTLRESGFLESFNSMRITYRILFDLIYDILLDEYRCEYVYKNIIAHQLLLKRHSLKSSSLLSEVYVGNSKADIVIMNGNSSVYEIKTELDNIDRLRGQLSDYKNVFDNIFVVAHPSQLEKICSQTDLDVGLIVLDDDLQLRTIRDARSNKHNVRSEIIFDTLRRKEYLQIIKKEFGRIPDVPNTLIYQKCKSLFRIIPPVKAHDYMVEALRKRAYSQDTTNRLEVLPDSLSMVCLDDKLTKNEWNNFCEVIEYEV